MCTTNTSVVFEGNFYDHLTLGLVKTLSSIQGIENVKLDRREPCEKSAINAWEQRHSCILPYDMKNFYLSSDGFEMTWSYNSNCGDEIPLGNMRINCLADLRRRFFQNVPNNNIEGDNSPSLADLNLFVSKSDKERPLFKASCKIFELDPCRDIAVVCLVYVEHKITPSIWLVDKSLEFHFIAPSFTHYFRMMLVYQGLPQWQLNLTPIGLSPWAEQIMYTFTPHLQPTPTTKYYQNITEVHLDPSLFKMRSKHSKKVKTSAEPEKTEEEPKTAKSCFSSSGRSQTKT